MLCAPGRPALSPPFPLPLDEQRGGAAHRRDSGERGYAGGTLPPWTLDVVTAVWSFCAMAVWCNEERVVTHRIGGCVHTVSARLDFILVGCGAMVVTAPGDGGSLVTGVGLVAIAIDDVLDGAESIQAHGEWRGKARHERSRGGDAAGDRHVVVAEEAVHA